MMFPGPAPVYCFVVTKLSTARTFYNCMATYSDFKHVVCVSELTTLPFEFVKGRCSTQIQISSVLTTACSWRCSSKQQLTYTPSSYTWSFVLWFSATVVPQSWTYQKTEVLISKIDNISAIMSSSLRQLMRQIWTQVTTKPASADTAHPYQHLQP